MRLKEKKPTTKVIARVKTRAKQTVEITEYTNPANPYQDQLGWNCKGCKTEHEGASADTRGAVIRHAGDHADRCRIIPA